MEHSILIDDLQNGKEEGLTAIFRRYNRPLLYFSLQFVDHETAEEIVADTFVKVWELRTRFHTIERLRAFLYISTKNACLNHLRSQQAKVEVRDVAEYENLLSEDTDVCTKIIKTELLKQIYEEVAKLPDKQRDVFQLTYWEDLTVEEISKKLKISASAVYTNRSRAIDSLRNSLKINNGLYSLMLLQFLL